MQQTFLHRNSEARNAQGGLPAEGQTWIRPEMVHGNLEGKRNGELGKRWEKNRGEEGEEKRVEEMGGEGVHPKQRRFHKQKHGRINIL